MSRAPSVNPLDSDRPNLVTEFVQLAEAKSESRGWRLARLLWLAFAVVMVVKPLIETSQHTTYPGFETGTRNYLKDVDPYTISWFEYRYSPAFATAFSAFAVLPTRVGSVLWNVVSLAALWWGLGRLLRDVLPQRWSRDRQGAFLGLALLITFRGLWASQSTPLLIGLACAACAEVVRQRWWRASYFLAIPVAIKVWPLALALLLISCRPRHLLLRFCTAMGMVALSPLLLKSPKIVWWQYQNWFQALMGPVLHIRHFYRDIWAIWEVVAPPVPPHGYMALQLGSAAFVLALCLWQRFRAPSSQHWVTFTLAAWTTWQLSVGPGVERNTFSLIAPILAWGVIASQEIRFSRGLPSMALALIIVFSFGVVERELVERVPLVLGALPIGALLLGTWVMLCARRWPELADAHQASDAVDKSIASQHAPSQRAA